MNRTQGGGSTKKSLEMLRIHGFRVAAFYIPSDNGALVMRIPSAAMAEAYQ
jgi:hypothetical protein